MILNKDSSTILRSEILECCKSKSIFLISFETSDIWKVCLEHSKLQCFSKHIKSKEVISNAL